MERRPQSGEWYRDFENRLYQVVTIAVHSGTGEELVVYQELYGEYRVCAGPLGMFLKEGEGAKYPQAAQKYRFERVEKAGGGPEPSGADEAGGFRQAENEGRGPEPSGADKAGGFRQAENEGRGPEPSGTEEKRSFERTGTASTGEADSAEGTADGVSPKLMSFFDADDLEEKYHILLSMREEITDHLINNMAVVLDVVIPEGDIDSRYEELKRCIRTRQRYESDRLR